MRSPGPAGSSLPSILNMSEPFSTSKRSSCEGWTCAFATKPFGLTKHSITAASPFVSADVLRKTIRSPVTGFSIESPARIIASTPFVRLRVKRSGAALTANLRHAYEERSGKGKRFEFRLLGPLEVESNGAVLPVGGPRQRALLAFLLLHANDVVSRDTLVDA